MSSKGKLVITKPWITTTKEKARLCAKIKSSDKDDYILWYEFDRLYEKYLTTEKADSFVVNLLMYAMEKGYDIESEQDISENMYYGITEFLIPAISRHIKKYKKIQIVASLSNTVLQCEEAVGASISCGVDSFYTVLRNLDRVESDFNITHLNFYNAGSNGNYGGDEARKKYRDRISLVSQVADQLGLPMICVDTNANEYIMQRHCGTETTRTLAIPLALQKLYAKYYFSSGYPYEMFRFVAEDSAHYDLLSTQCLSTENLCFYSSGAEATRLEKLRYISKYKVVNDHINVCIDTIHNCGKCEKCKRTIMGLYALNKLDLFSETFDVAYINKHILRYLITTVGYRHKHDWDEIYDELKHEHRIPFIAYPTGVIMEIFMDFRGYFSKMQWANDLYHKFYKK